MAYLCYPRGLWFWKEGRGTKKASRFKGQSKIPARAKNVRLKISSKKFVFPKEIFSTIVLTLLIINDLPPPISFGAVIYNIRLCAAAPYDVQPVLAQVADHPAGGPAATFKLFGDGSGGERRVFVQEFGKVLQPLVVGLVAHSVRFKIEGTKIRNGNELGGGSLEEGVKNK